MDLSNSGSSHTLAYMISPIVPGRNFFLSLIIKQSGLSKGYIFCDSSMESLVTSERYMFKQIAATFCILIFNLEAQIMQHARNNMNKALLVIAVLVILTQFSFTGCVTKKPIMPQPVKQKTMVSRDIQAKRELKIGKELYLEFYFTGSIRRLKKAISYNPSNSVKAVCYIYLGANYFYIQDYDTANECFLAAKRANYNVKPDRSMFPSEIIEAYRKAK
jgi:tetratricopeptide (TPR) repeat protein